MDSRFRYLAGPLAKVLQRRRHDGAPGVAIAGPGTPAVLTADNPAESAAGKPAADRFLRHRGLIAFSAGCTMAEAAVLIVLAPAAKSLAPQVTALPPLAVFHDVRWLFGYNRSWSGFGAGALIIVLGRAALNTVMVRLAWPRDLRAPRAAATFAASAAFALVAGILMVPIVTLVFGVAVLPFSWPFLAAVPALLAIALPLSHGGVSATWWRRLPPHSGAGWALACFVEYSVLAVVITRLPSAGVVPVAGLAGIVNARAWYGMTAAVARPSRARAHSVLAWIPVAPLAAISVFALAIGTTRLIFDANSVPQPGLAAASTGIAAAASQVGGQAVTVKLREKQPAVLVIGGFGSSCCHTFRTLRAASGLVVEQFSYLGLDAAGKPIPQGRAASDLPMQALGDMIATQVRRLHAQTGRPVDLVAESEGSLGVYAMFARHPDVPVGSVVLLSPIVAPGQVSFPQAGRQGPGVASGYALSVLNQLVGEMSPFGASGAERLIESVSSVGARYAAATAVRGMSKRWLALVPLADALTLPACDMPSSVLFVPAFHGGLLGDPAALRTVGNFLRGQEVHGPQSLRQAAEILSAAAAAWRMPERSAPSPPCPS